MSTSRRSDTELLISGYLREMESTLSVPVPSALNSLFADAFHVPSVRELKEQRDKITDEAAGVKMEELIIFEISMFQPCAMTAISTNLHLEQLTYERDLLRTILQQWQKTKQIEHHKSLLHESMHRSIKNENVKILKILMNSAGFQRSTLNLNEQVIELINYAAKTGSFECIRYLWRFPQKHDWIAHRKVVCLLNAVKYHSYDTDLIDYIVDKLEEYQLRFVCDEVMKEVIVLDLAQVAKRLIENRWHTISPEDELSAQRVNGECFRLFRERAEALRHIEAMYDANGQEVIDLDDGWDEQQDDEDEWGEFSD